MTSLEWCYLAKKFFEFKNAATPLGFYVPELAGMEDSLMKCRPFAEDAKAMERVGALVEEDVNNRTYVTSGRHVEAVKVTRADASGLSVDTETPVEWLNSAMEQGKIYFHELHKCWYVRTEAGVEVSVNVGDYILYDLGNGSLYAAEGFMFNSNFNKVQEVA